MKKLKLNEIRRPETVEEFQTNLKRFYQPYGTDSLYVKPVDGDAFGIKYSDIEHFNDIYRLTESGMKFDWTSPSIVPLVACDVFQMMRNPQEQEVFDAKDLKIGEVIELTIEQGHSWVPLDNKGYREIYGQTLGKFSGYEYPESLYREVA